MEKQIKLGNHDVTVLDEKVLVFHNIMDDNQGLIDFYESQEEWWSGWYGFGRQIMGGGPAIENSKEFPTKEVWESEIVNTDYRPEDPFRMSLERSFYDASSEYFDYTGTSLPSWGNTGWGIARYIPDEDIINNPDLTMVHHTDYMENTKDQPGRKYAVTAVYYPNDDYEGGELSIRKVDETTNKAIVKINYKPKAGDLVFFPSGRPYLHGVRRVWNKPKYIIRFYWLYEYEGSPEWFRLKEKYGDKFEKLEKDRVSDPRLLMSDPYLRERFTISEYYELYEKGYVINGRLDIESVPNTYGIPMGNGLAD